MSLETIQEFIVGQIANAGSPQAAQLAFQIRQAIQEYKENGGENENSFSVDAQYNEGEFTAQVNFAEDHQMTIMYGEDTSNETVASLFDCSNEQELCRLAGLMLSEGWVEGYQE